VIFILFEVGEMLDLEYNERRAREMR